MTSRARLLATVLLLTPTAFACGKEAEPPPVTTAPASPAADVAATYAPAVASSPAPTTITPSTRPKQPAGSPAPAVAAAARPPAAAEPKAPVTTQSEKPTATQPAAPALPAGQLPKGKITLPAKLGAVTFEHETHAGKLAIACTTCHHPSRPEKPLTSENQACRDCHAMPPTPPVKTSLRAAFHDSRGATGTCIDCHKQKGGSAPVECVACHKKKAGSP